VLAAWGSGIVETDFVAQGGLTPVGPVITSLYAYDLASFARIVAEDPKLQDRKQHPTYADDAVRYAQRRHANAPCSRSNWGPSAHHPVKVSSTGPQLASRSASRFGPGIQARNSDSAVAAQDDRSLSS
jgi:hypothetical protein